MEIKLGSGQGLTPADGEKILAMYRDKYPECGITDGADGVRYKCPKHEGIFRGTDEQRALYWHAGDTIAYRAALRACRKAPIRVAPQDWPADATRPKFSKAEAAQIEQLF